MLVTSEMYLICVCRCFFCCCCGGGGGGGGGDSFVFVFSDLQQQEIDQPDTASTYEMLTYALAAVGALLIVTVIVMCVVLIRKSSVKKY